MAYLGWAIYNLGIIGGTAYLVQEHDWSPWWFLLAVLLMANLRGKE